MAREADAGAGGNLVATAAYWFATMPEAGSIRERRGKRPLPLAAEAERRARALDFDGLLADRGLAPLARTVASTLQINLGKRCNQACLHCHVEAGPRRTEVMEDAVVDRVLAVLAASPSVTTVDLTGGAPELHPRFVEIVRRARAMGRGLIDRCNLTVLLEPGMEDLPELLAAHDVRVVASLPCYSASNVDAQRGEGVFEASLRALARLNAIGYGQPGSARILDLVYNPSGPFLPPAQAALEATYRAELRARFGVEFHRLLTITNIPIRRFAHALARDGQLEGYLQLLAARFNEATVESVMCRSLVSVAWDGRLHDCDFNQMLEIRLGARAATIWDLESLDALTGARIATEGHCQGCTAGAGSSCGGALEGRA